MSVSVMGKDEFNYRKELLKLERENSNQKHRNKMEEMAFERENNSLFHEKELERIRIKSASIRRTQEAKAMGDYWNHQTVTKPTKG